MIAHLLLKSLHTVRSLPLDLCPDSLLFLHSRGHQRRVHQQPVLCCRAATEMFLANAHHLICMDFLIGSAHRSKGTAKYVR